MSHLIDRTKHQPVVWRCLNPECAQGTGLRNYEFNRDHPKCDRCGAERPYVVARALIHMLVRDEHGPIVGDFGLRFKLACEGKRDYLATETNEEAATGDYRAVNCESCLKVLGNNTIVVGQSLSVA